MHDLQGLHECSGLEGRSREVVAAGTLKRGTLNTWHLIVMVVGVQVPLGSVVALVPVSIGFGSGIGTPVTWLVAGSILLSFAVGWSRMSRHITNSGAFYAYIARSLGLPLGIAGAAVATLAYNALTIAAVSILGSFARQVILNLTGIDLTWQGCVLITLAIIAIAAYNKLDLSVRLLSMVMVIELIILCALAIAILAGNGFAGFPAQSFSPRYILAPGAGITMAIAVWVSLGFESAAVYGEEAKDPRKSVSRASYASILLITSVYVLMAWVVIAGAGGVNAQRTAAADPAGLVFGLYATYLGAAAGTFVQVWSILAIVAACIACHNLAARYFYVLGREGILPSALGNTRGSSKVPWNASLTQLAIMLVILSVFMVIGTDPYLILGSGLLGLTVIGIVGLMAVTSLGIFWFFRKERHQFFSCRLMPGISFAGLCLILHEVISNYGVLSGFESGPMRWVPYIAPLVAITAFSYSLYLRSARPSSYERMRATLDKL